MDPKILALLGTALSSLIAAVSYWAKTRHERRRATRTVLYLLLEAHHVVRRTQAGLTYLPKMFIDHCRNTLRDRCITLTEEDANKLLSEFRPAMRIFATNKLQRVSCAIAEPFDKALGELSREDPVLAFRLRGSDQFALLATSVEEFVLALPRQGPENSPSLGVKEALEAQMHGVAVEELERAIRATAWRCDVLTHIEVMLLLYRASKEQKSSEVDELVKTLTEKLLQPLLLKTP